MSVSVGVGVNVGCVSVMSMEGNGGCQWGAMGGCQWGRFFLTTLGIHLGCNFKVVKKNRPH
mgnify:CR=1 FL=1|jgi:hypothetical protein